MKFKDTKLYKLFFYSDEELKSMRESDNPNLIYKDGFYSGVFVGVVIFYMVLRVVEYVMDYLIKT